MKKSVLAVPALPALAAPEPVKVLPDFVVIAADDLGHMDVGAHNPDSFYDTPRPAQ